MKILVFGRNGQVSTEIQRLADVTALGRDEADFLKPEICTRKVEEVDPDAVIIAAGYTAVDRAESDQAVAQTVNATTPSLIAAEAAKRGIPLVYISTDYVFDGSGKTPWTPDRPTNPINYYGQTKVAGEEGVRKAGGEHAILRTSWTFSAIGQNFVKTMLRLADQHERLRIVDDQIGGPTPAKDIAKACLGLVRALKSDHQTSGIYHLSGRENVSWAEFAAEIFKQAEKKTVVEGIPTKEYPTAAARPLNSRLNCERLESVLNITQPDWRSGLAQVLKELNR